MFIKNNEFRAKMSQQPQIQNLHTILNTHKKMQEKLNAPMKHHSHKDDTTDKDKGISLENPSKLPFSVNYYYDSKRKRLRYCRLNRRFEYQNNL